MAKVMKTWDVNGCIKGTNAEKYYYCACASCCQERAEKVKAQIQAVKARDHRLKRDIAQYWSDQYTASDKQVAISLVIEPEEQE